MLIKVYNVWKTSVNFIFFIQDINWVMSIQSFSSLFFNEIAKLKSNSLNLDSSNDSLMLFLLSYNWVNIDDDDAVDVAA